MTNGELISPILAAYAEIRAYSKSRRTLLQETLRERRKKNLEMMTLAKAEGLRLRELAHSDALHDLFDTDDTGRLVECLFKVLVRTREEAVKAVSFCHAHKFLALPIGARTSALGAFEAEVFARREGLSGMLGIQVEEVNRATAGEKGNDYQLLIPEFSAADYELIQDPSGAMALLVSKQFPKYPHRVIAHAGAHIRELNQFLNENLNHERYCFRVMPDPTSQGEAQIGGVLAAGAEGGNRSNAAEDLSSLLIISADGKEVFLRGAEAKALVGMNGCAGLIFQAEFEVSSFPKHDHGIFIPIRGSGKEAWLNLLRLQHRLKSFCSPATSPRMQVGEGDAGIIVTGIELLGKNALQIALGEEGKDGFEQLIMRMMKNSEFGVFVTFSSYFETGSLELYEGGFVKETLQVDFESLETDKDENFLVDTPLYSSLRFLSPQERSHLDQIRHSAPAHARELARRMGGVTESTDMNLRFTSESEEENEQAFQAVAALYHQYADGFTVNDGFQTAIYGHLHPGTGHGGGIDPHIRVVFELSNPGSRYNAPEQVMNLKKRRGKLDRSLLALDGTMGIQILAPEKSCFGGAEYWNWLCLKYPNQARQSLETVRRYGYSHEVNGGGYGIFGARVPHLLPGIFPIPEAGKALLQEPLFAIVQHPVRSGKIRLLLRTVLSMLHEKLELSESQYPFFIERTSEAKAILARNFGDDHPIKLHVEEVKKFQGGLCLNEEICYSLELGLENLAVMIVPAALISQAATRKGNEAVFRNLQEMWSGWPYQTMETPNTWAIAELGRKLLDGDFQDAPGPLKSAVSFSVSPAQIHHEVHLAAEEFKNNVESDSSELQVRAIKRLKEYLGIPDQYQSAFFGSVTQAFQMTVEAIQATPRKLNLIQVVADASSERFSSMLKVCGKPVTRIEIPWTTTENSQLKPVVSGIRQALSQDPEVVNILFVTPHKTSTTADFLPDHLVNALARFDLIMGRDYQMICDVFSGAGARNYARLSSPDTGSWRVPFTGLFGTGSAALGLPPGMAFAAFSPGLAEIFSHKSSPWSLGKRFLEAQAGRTPFTFLLYLLGHRLSNDIGTGRYPSTREEESRRKFRLVMGWLETHPDLICLIPNGADQSPLSVGIFSQAKNLGIARRILRDVYGFLIDPGLGPFERESLRLYLPNVSYDQLLDLLAALDVVLDLPDVVHTRGEHVPNIALREPHDPLSVISQVAANCTVDDILRNQLGLQWLGRLIRTYNANVMKNDERKQLGGKIPVTSGAYQTKARIYGESQNLVEMKKILNLKNEESKLDLLFHFQLFRELDEHIRSRILGQPNSCWADDSFSATIAELLRRARKELSEITRLLLKYAGGDPSELSEEVATNGLPATKRSGSAEKASRDEQGRVKWPIVA